MGKITERTHQQRRCTDGKYTYEKISLCVITELQVKTTMRYHYLPIHMTKIQQTDIPIAPKDAEQQKLSFIDGGKAKWQLL